MHVVIFTGGTFLKNKHTKKIIYTADMIIAADSGADTALSYHILPDAVVGDMDSISQKTKRFLIQHNCEFFPSPSEKDETDTELALACAIGRGAKKITLLGGMQGDRFDHIIANLLLLASSPIDIICFNNNQTFWISHGPNNITISGKKGDLVSLIPIKDTVKGITTEGLYYPLHNENLLFSKPRGVSNVLTRKTATITFQKGSLLFVHTQHS